MSTAFMDDHEKATIKELVNTLRYDVLLVDNYRFSVDSLIRFIEANLLMLEERISTYKSIENKKLDNDKCNILEEFNLPYDDVSITFLRTNCDNIYEADYNEDGYDKYGFDRTGIHNFTWWQYDENGFDKQGLHKITKSKYNTKGYDRDGINIDGYAMDGTNSALHDYTNHILISDINKLKLKYNSQMPSGAINILTETCLYGYTMSVCKIKEFIGSDKNKEMFCKNDIKNITNIYNDIINKYIKDNNISSINYDILNNANKIIAYALNNKRNLAGIQLKSKELIGIFQSESTKNRCKDEFTDYNGDLSKCIFRIVNEMKFLTNDKLELIAKKYISSDTKLLITHDKLEMIFGVRKFNITDFTLSAFDYL